MTARRASRTDESHGLTQENLLSRRSELGLIHRGRRLTQEEGRRRRDLLLTHKVCRILTGC